jgi:hypothetical protein
VNELPGAQAGFVVMKSYDGGRNWEPARQCGDFVTATDLAQALRSEHPAIRTRVDVRAVMGRIRVRRDRA